MPGARSTDPAARARSLANLKRGDNPAPQRNTRTLRHGADSEVAASVYGRIWERELFDRLTVDSELKGNADFAAYIGVLAGVMGKLELVNAWLRPRLADLSGRSVLQALDAASRLERQAFEALAALRLGPGGVDEEFLAKLDAIEAALRSGSLNARQEVVIVTPRTLPPAEES